MTSTAQLRKIKKPVIERRRRERINDCLQILKTLILEAEKKEPSRYSKMEKADILEMTVKHLKSLHHVLLESPTPRSQCSPPSSPPTTPQYRQLDENNNVITTQHTESHSPNSFVVGVGDNSTERVINKELRKFNEGYDVCAMEVDHFLSTKTVTDLHSFSNKTNLDSNRSFLRSVTSEQSHQSVGFGDSASKHLVYLTKNAEQEIKTSSPKCTSNKIVNENTFSNRHVSGNDSCSFSSTHLNTFPNVTTNSFCPKVESSGKSLEQYSSFVPFSVPASTFDKSVPLKDVKSFTGNIFSSGSVGSSTLFTVVSPDSTYMNNAAPCLISSTRQSVIPLYATVPISCPVNILPVAALNAQCHDMSRDVTVNNIRCDSLPIQSITSVKKYEHSMNRESSFTTLLKCGSPQLGDDFPRSFNNNNHYSSPTSTQVLFYKASEGEVNNGRVACSSRGGGSPQTPATGSNTSSITVATDADMWRPWSFQ